MSEAGVIARRLAQMRRDAMLVGVAFGVLCAAPLSAALAYRFGHATAMQALPLHCSWPADSVRHTGDPTGRTHAPR